MSFLGKVQARCPNGCEPQHVEIWSFVDAGRDPALRETLIGGDLNLIRCESCGTIFYPEATVVYYDAEAKILAFVFPESHRSEEARWRKKMEEDYEQMRKILPEAKGVAVAPQIYFGIDSLRQQLQGEESLQDEVDVAAVISHELKLALYPVSRSFARSHNLPWLLPCQGPATLASAANGLRILLEANDRLEGYRRWQKALAAMQALPPRD